MCVDYYFVALSPKQTSFKSALVAYAHFSLALIVYLSTLDAIFFRLDLPHFDLSVTIVLASHSYRCFSSSLNMT